MIGFVLINLLTVAACLGAIRYPLVGVGTYVGFAVLRPHFLFGWAGDLSGISYWVGIATFVGWFVNRTGNWRLGRGGTALAFLGLYSLWSVASSFTAISPAVAFASLQNLAKVAIPVLIGVTLLDRVETRRRMLWVMVLAMGYVGFEMHIQYLSRGFNHAHVVGFGGMDNNCFGAALAAMIGPAVALVVTSRTWYERAAASVAGLLILHTAILTFSRGTMVGLIAVGLVALVMMPKRPKYMAALVIALAIALRLSGPEVVARFATTFAETEERDGSAQSRVDLWRDCLMVVGDYPVLGVGPANWRVIAYQYGWTEGKSAHSVWMETAAELGIPGSLFLLLFFLVPAAQLWRIARERVTDQNRDDVAVAIATVLSVTGFVVSAQFVSVPGLENPYYMVMVGLALLKARSAAVPAGIRAPVPAAASAGLSVAPTPALDVLPRPGRREESPAMPKAPRILDLGPRHRAPGRG
jgi:O-antigen ligase